MVSRLASTQDHCLSLPRAAYYHRCAPSCPAPLGNYFIGGHKGNFSGYKTNLKVYTNSVVLLKTIDFLLAQHFPCFCAAYRNGCFKFAVFVPF